MINFQDLPAVAWHLCAASICLRAQPISIGRLGQQHFPIGDYFYVGSARGAGGLRARVGRHLRGDGALTLAHRLLCALSLKCKMCSTR